MKQDYSPFSVALIDVFASALGVFMIFSAISMPFILNTSTVPEQPIAETPTTQGNLDEVAVPEGNITEELVAIIESLEQENESLKKQASNKKTIYD